MLGAIRQVLLPTGVRLTSTSARVATAQARLTAYHSIDHDGCLGLRYTDPSVLAVDQQDFIRHVIDEKASKGYTESFVTIGSNRQNIRLDALNALYNENHLAAPIIKAFAKATGAWFDPFVLSDITANQKAGFNHMRLSALAKEAGVNLQVGPISPNFLELLLNKQHPTSLFSTDKIDQLYAQLQRAGHIQGHVDFHYYDDRITDILGKLKEYYERYPTLIPANITLHLHHYATNDMHEGPAFTQGPQIPTLYATIKGEGKLDQQYYQTVRNISEVAKQEEGKQSAYHLADYLTPQLMFNPPSKICSLAKSALTSIGLFKTEKKTDSAPSITPTDSSTPAPKK